MSDDETQNGSLCGGCRRQLEAGWYLCEQCSGRLAADLLEVAERYHELTAAPAMEPGRYDRSGGRPGSKPPVRLDVVILRDRRSGRVDPKAWQGRDKKWHHEDATDTPSVLRLLMEWVYAIAVERGYEHGPVPTVDDAVAWLNRQDDWIARWPDSGDLKEAARKLRNRLRRAVGDANDPPIGDCYRQVTETDGTVRECGAPIFAPETKPGMTPAVRCSSRRYRHEWDGRDLLRLQGVMEKQRADAEAKRQEEQRAQEEAC